MDDRHRQKLSPIHPVVAGCIVREPALQFETSCWIRERLWLSYRFWHWVGLWNWTGEKVTWRTRSIGLCLDRGTNCFTAHDGDRKNAQCGASNSRAHVPLTPLSCSCSRPHF